MNSLGFLSGKLERGQRTLHEINLALLALQAETLGVREQLDLDAETAARSRETVAAFVEAVRKSLRGEADELDLRPLVDRIRGESKPELDWIEDLGSLVTTLRSGESLSAEQFSVLGDVVRLIDAGFTEDLTRLYGRR